MEVIEDLGGVGAGKPVPGSGNKRPQEFADYCKVGPTRVPFVTFPEAKLAEAKGRAAHWMELNKKYVLCGGDALTASSLIKKRAWSKRKPSETGAFCFWAIDRRHRLCRCQLFRASF
jgi:hypothetical protein